MVDSLYGLRHYAIVRSNHKNCNIGRICTAHTHCGKCLMSGGIQEGYSSSLNVYSICTNVLCNTSGLLICHICLTNCIQQRGFAVVNVTHNTDYGRSFHQILFILLVLLQQFLDNVHLHFLLAEDVVLHGNVFRILIGNLLVYRHNLTLQEQLLHNCGGLQFHLFCQLLDGDGLRQRDNLDYLLYHLFLLLFRLDESSGLIL